MEQGRENNRKQNGIKYANKVHNEAYFAGFHRGRQKLRDIYVNSKWLIINPDKLSEIKLAASDPCKNCPNGADYLKIGCTANPKDCNKKQKQFLAIEILTYFS